MFYNIDSHKPPLLDEGTYICINYIVVCYKAFIKWLYTAYEC